MLIAISIATRPNPLIAITKDSEILGSGAVNHTSPYDCAYKVRNASYISNCNQGGLETYNVNLMNKISDLKKKQTAGVSVEELVLKSQLRENCSQSLEQYLIQKEVKYPQVFKYRLSILGHEALSIPYKAEYIDKSCMKSSL